MKSKFMRMVGGGEVSEDEGEEQVFQEYEPEEQPIKEDYEDVKHIEEVKPTKHIEEEKILPKIPDANIDSIYNKFKEVNFISIYTEKREYVLDVLFQIKNFVSVASNKMVGGGRKKIDELQQEKQNLENEITKLQEQIDFNKVRLQKLLEYDYEKSDVEYKALSFTNISIKNKISNLQTKIENINKEIDIQEEQNKDVNLVELNNYFDEEGNVVPGENYNFLELLNIANKTDDANFYDVVLNTVKDKFPNLDEENIKLLSETINDYTSYENIEVLNDTKWGEGILEERKNILKQYFKDYDTDDVLVILNHLKDDVKMNETISTMLDRLTFDRKITDKNAVQMISTQILISRPILAAQFFDKNSLGKIADKINNNRLLNYYIDNKFEANKELRAKDVLPGGKKKVYPLENITGPLTEMFNNSYCGNELSKIFTDNFDFGSAKSDIITLIKDELNDLNRPGNTFLLNIIGNPERADVELKKEENGINYKILYEIKGNEDRDDAYTTFEKIFNLMFDIKEFNLSKTNKGVFFHSFFPWGKGVKLEDKIRNFESNETFIPKRMYVCDMSKFLQHISDGRNNLFDIIKVGKKTDKVASLSNFQSNYKKILKSFITNNPSSFVSNPTLTNISSLTVKSMIYPSYEYFLSKGIFKKIDINLQAPLPPPLPLPQTNVTDNDGFEVYVSKKTKKKIKESSKKLTEAEQKKPKPKPVVTPTKKSNVSTFKQSPETPSRGGLFTQPELLLLQRLYDELGTNKYSIKYQSLFQNDKYKWGTIDRALEFATPQEIENIKNADIRLTSPKPNFKYERVL